MKPKPREQQDYEKVVVGEFITGIIEDIRRDESHKSMYQGKEKISDCVRFKFKLDGYEHPHYSRWMTFTYGEKSNLYQKYIAKLVANAEPDMDFDIELLKGMKVKTLWAEDNDYQHLESIFPIGPKIGEREGVKPFPPAKKSGAPSSTTPDDEVPF